MRSIPVAVREKLLSRIKSAATDSEVSMRLVAVQRSVNTLLTEAIHEDAVAAHGDIAISQPEEDSIYCAYAICVDSGVAAVYSRRFPADEDYAWNRLFEVGSATEVAIEFDGVWTHDATQKWFFLKTETHPYIFFVSDGDLYAQHWNDATTRVLLAEDVSSVSACKGWTSSINAEDDQGLVVAYIRDGAVYYRTYAYSAVAGGKLWETEQPVTSLGSGNTGVSVTRTNDFRIGFVAEQSGTIQMAVTKRTYPGQSVPPESLTVGTVSSSLTLSAAHYLSAMAEESLTVQAQRAYFLLDGTTDSRIAITGTERLYASNENGFYCSGVKVYLSKELLTSPPAQFVSGTTTSVSGKVTIASVTYDSDSVALVVSFAWRSGVTPDTLPSAFTVSFPMNTELTYAPLEGQTWYMESATASMTEITNEYYANDGGSYLTVASTGATFNLIAAQYLYGYGDDEHLTVATTSAAFTLVPAGDIPV